ncbi:DUF192 domain-containing protein [Candidatus Woesearchaeota archaeon]|nr:DUF192 domain-containing protein [Candidatus Woesearchaeota archaeon]
MPIINATTNKVIAAKSKAAYSLLSRSIGLMFSKPSNSALIIKFRAEKRISLHMMFVFYPIDVLFVSRNREVVDIKENFRPFERFASRKNALYAIEVPSGTVRESRTKVGHRIEFLAVKEKTVMNGRSITITKIR